MYDVDDEHDPTLPEIRLQVTVSVLHGGLVLGSSAGVTLQQQVPALNPTAGDLVQPFQSGTYQLLTFQGRISNLNNVLRTLRYYGDANFNTGTFDEVVLVHVDDLGNTDYLPGQNRTNDYPLTLTVEPINDRPTIAIPAGLASAVDEDDPAGLLLVNPATGTGIGVDDLDDIHDPAVIQLQVTVYVLHGGLVLGTIPPALNFDVDADGDGTPDWVLASADGVQPMHDAIEPTHQRLVFQGTIADLNTALATLRYYNDANFNTGLAGELLTIEVNDLGYTDKDTAAHLPTDLEALTARTSLALTVRPSNDPPIVVAPDAIQGTEETNIALPGISVGDPVDGPDAATILQVTLQAIHGTLTINTTVPGGVVIASGNGTSSVVLIGTKTRLNTTFAHPTGVVYRGNLDYNNYSLDHDPDPDETIVVTVDDRGNGGAGGPRQSSHVVTVSVTPVNDAPLILSPGQKTLDEGTSLSIPLMGLEYILPVDGHNLMLIWL